ncbi:two-component system nitrate/nitrite response regulator NarL [Bosea sp. OAE752]|jgi:two-component system nitrate/nitrite response regulator NarL|uniref:LuxR C-terminal-related transcriptional regulator n=1 Tax=unclassified Bosea (in: a-proteobacteria) TaxID=2653178 RepID=UPI0009DD8EC3|nr:response regulator transcription factor [Bosea sp. UNC402CLCol]
MRESKAFGIVLIGKYSLMREGVHRVLQENNFRIIDSISGIDQLSGKSRVQNSLFLVVYTNDAFDLIIGEIELVRDRYPDAHIAVVADRYGPAELAAVFKAGASGYLVNTNSCDAFVKSIELVMLGETVFPPTFPSAVPAAKKPRRPKAGPAAGEDDRASPSSPPDETVASLLSPREMGIVSCLVDGDSNKSIARKIGIAEATVKAHVKAILRKIRVQNRTQAAIWGMNNALLLQPANNNARAASASAGKRLPDSAAGVGAYQ